MSYTSIVCPRCNSKQTTMLGPGAVEIKCSACNSMVSVAELKEIRAREMEREEQNAKMELEVARVS